RRAVSQDILGLDHVTFLHQRTLVDAGVLVGTGVLDHRVDIDARFTGFNLVIRYTDHDTAGIDRVDHTTTTGGDTDAGITRYVTLHASTYQRLLGTQGGYSLTLHVRTHQGAVGIVVLKERNQRRGDRYNLAR